MTDQASDVALGSSQPGSITVEPVGPHSPDYYRFVATTSSGDEILASEPFISLIYPPGNGRYERRIVRALVTELAVMGWKSVPAGKPWYEHHLYHVGSGRVAPAPPKPREGLSVQAMWGWSIAVIIVLFAICVVLALTSEIRISPA